MLQRQSALPKEQVISDTISVYGTPFAATVPLTEQEANAVTLPEEAHYANAETQDTQWHQIEAAALEDALARAVLDVSPHVRTIAEPALHLSLPTLTNEHYGQLGPFAVPALCHLLEHKKERLFAYHVRTERLVLQSLHALGKIGTGEAVPSVGKVAQDGWTAGVREVALQVLPLLLERKRQENDSHILLRASALPQSGEHLLRAASPSLHDDAPQQLLRPQVSE